MTPQELKNSIMQLAIQGKLVEQRAEEGTGEELYHQIQAEKQRLIKSSELKKTKKLPEITDDTLPYDFPSTWKVCYIDDIAFVTKLAGFEYTKNVAPNLSTAGIPLFKGKNVQNGNVVLEFESFIPQSVSDKLSRSQIRKKCLLTPYVGTIGNIAIFDGSFRAHLGSNVGKIELLNSDERYILEEYVLYYLRSSIGYQELTKYKKATAQESISIDAIRNVIIAVPPLAEQKRIVAKIEELLPYIDRYEKAWSKLEDFNKRFPTDMHKSILQMAIQGKLVEQRPEEGTGEELFQQIRTEKQKLIKAGTIKKEKPFLEITEAEKPFDIPESWKWVRIGQIFSLQAGKNITASDIYEEQSPEHSFLCYGGNGIRGYVSSNNKRGHYALIGRQGALCGNINFANSDFYATEHAVVVDHFQMCDVLWSGYFLRALNLNQYATATAQPGLAVNNIVKVLTPLPPLAEQKRIVAKLEKILPLCEKLK